MGSALTCHGRCIPWNRWLVLVLLIQLLHSLQVVRIVLEDYKVLVLQVLLQHITLKDGLELKQEAERMVSRAYVLKAAVDKGLQLDLEVVDVHIELQKVSVKLGGEQA